LRVGIPLEGASDRGVSAALYLCGPDGNGVELYGVGHAKSGRARKMASLQWSLEPLIVGQLALIKFPKKWRIRKCCLIHLKKTGRSANA
jgi:catechol-2,3-dioxygenase